MATSPGQIRPWRYLASFVGVVAVLYSLVFFTGDGSATPKLGIDLQGGTRVTLEARTETGAEPPREQLEQARAIIQQRVDGLGVGGSEVVLDGNNLTITVPGDDGEQARSLGQTAQLRFREVIAGPVPTTPAPDPNAPADPAAPAGETPAPAPEPQGAADPSNPLVTDDVEPVAQSTPLDTPPPPPTPEPAPPAGESTTPEGPADPEIAAAAPLAARPHRP
ncbi:MAG: protein translocase subunit SecD, partial [Pseudonocardia sp.]|nr:protein translocase subunit SecD [Pseudonocardia sp.]